MADFQYAQARTGAQTGDMATDAGLRKFMLGVYNKLTLRHPARGRSGLRRGRNPGR